ncbi:PqqD family peptide modification chaperone [Streptomyces sp. Z26]|uniref:PqqD family peptide modification chaperone n=1 Tax=Streptomyces sp. Z26 TaxID=2500177 RepID=UPI000EF147B7|nr:PqqD family peptide modification chaperone [Streptomyces sp. Z26]RLL68514.1 PqqD family protein [Streptomyces sp. Z26]
MTTTSSDSSAFRAHGPPGPPVPLRPLEEAEQADCDAPFVPLELPSYVVATPTADGMALRDDRSGACWELNAPAALVLRALLRGADVPKAAALLTARHPDTAGRAEGEIDVLVRRLHDAGLAQPCDGRRAGPLRRPFRGAERGTGRGGVRRTGRVRRWGRLRARVRRARRRAGARVRERAGVRAAREGRT